MCPPEEGCSGFCRSRRHLCTLRCEGLRVALCLGMELASEDVISAKLSSHKPREAILGEVEETGQVLFNQQRTA